MSWDASHGYSGPGFARVCQYMPLLHPKSSNSPFVIFLALLRIWLFQLLRCNLVQTSCDEFHPLRWDPIQTTVSNVRLQFLTSKCSWLEPLSGFNRKPTNMFYPNLLSLLKGVSFWRRCRKWGKYRELAGWPTTNLTNIVNKQSRIPQPLAKAFGTIFVYHLQSHVFHEYIVWRTLRPRCELLASDGFNRIWSSHHSAVGIQEIQEHKTIGGCNYFELLIINDIRKWVEMRLQCTVLEKQNVEYDL